MPACLMKAMSASASLTAANSSPAVKTAWWSKFVPLDVVLLSRLARLFSTVASLLRLQAWPEILDLEEG